MNYRKLLLRTGSILASGFVAAPLAFAQDSSASKSGALSLEKSGALEEIVVAARKRQELLQEVPASITVVSSDVLATYNVSDIQSLPNLAPGMSISGSGGLNGQLISMRGISNQSGNTFNQATAIYVDGVYMPRPDGAMFALDDVERIEVLRGPQGTLYGRNATAGAINIISRKPGDELAGGINLRYGNHDSIFATGSVSGPLGGGFSAGISGAYDEHEGYFKNTLSGRTLGDQSSNTVRGALRYVSPNQKLDVILRGDRSEGDSEEIFTFRIPQADPWDVQLNPAFESQIGSESEQYGGSLELSYALNDHVDLVSITGLRELESTYAFSSNNAFVLTTFNNVDTLSEEIRADVSFDLLDATVGFHYYREEQDTGIANLPGANVPLVGKSELDAYAGFGQVSVHVTDKVTLDAGVRYNYEKRDVVASMGPLVLPASMKDSVWLSTGGVNYQVRPDVLLYTKYSRGYQAGSYNQLPIGSPPAVDTFDPEYLDSYEAGMKAQFFDKRLTLNFAYFYSDYQDLQVRTGFEPFVIEFLNAASAKIDGVEAEVRMDVGSGLTLSGNVAWTDARYKDFCESLGPIVPQNGDPSCTTPGGQPGAQRAGESLINSPEWTGNAALDYVGYLSFGKVHGNVSYAYRDSTNFISAHDRLTESGSLSLLNARLGVTLPSGVEIYGFGKNLTNDSNLEWSQLIALDLAVMRRSAPRTYGLGISYRY